MLSELAAIVGLEWDWADSAGVRAVCRRSGRPRAQCAPWYEWRGRIPALTDGVLAAIFRINVLAVIEAPDRDRAQLGILLQELFFEQDAAEVLALFDDADDFLA